jgi:serine/threonine-protein kinase
LTGRTFGDFQVLRRIGSGGMGQVYLARQLSLKREVALKFLRSDLNANTTALKRFQTEAEAVARLNHANIVHIYEIRECDGLWYMALEYVDGRNLRDYLARKGPPDLPVCLSIIRQVAAALQKAHEEGIVHRDIKPENILVTRKVEVKVTDFGLSRFFTAEAPATNLTQSGVTVGTPLYMSPEQVQGKPTDHRSDVYSFGVTCYHLLAGEPPFRGATAFDVAIKHVQDHPRPLSDLRPDLPADLSAMVHRMMAKSPADRYQSARDVLRDLAKVREGLSLGLAAAPVGPHASGQVAALSLSGLVSNGAIPSGTTLVTAPPRPVRWGRWLLAGAACVLAAAGGVVVYARTHRPEPTPTPPPPAPGLPDVRPAPPEKLTTSRERELLAALGSRETPPERLIAASIELALLYLRERRTDGAEERFKRMEKEQFAGQPLATQAAHLGGRLGRAVVLAYRDRAAESNRLFEDVLREPFPKAGPKVDRVALVHRFLLGHPDLFEAVSEALNRNAANLGLTALSPPALERLRAPRGVGRKD